MKAGDMVELSAYGNKIETIQRLRGDIGLVMSCCFYSAHIKWTRNGFCHVNRRDIKKVKVNADR